MRAAERNDYIRRLSTARGKWGRYISTLSIMSFKGIENLDINFVPNINIIVGANGTGKTPVLEAVRISLDNEDLRNIRLSSSSDLRSGRSATLVSSGRLTEIYQPYFQTLPDVGEALLTGLSPMECLAPELEEINYLLCRSYSAVKVYEVEPGLRVATSDDTDNTFSEETVPFFIVTRSGYEYSTIDMGSGEYAALYMWWSLHRSEKTIFLYLKNQ